MKNKKLIYIVGLIIFIIVLCLLIFKSPLGVSIIPKQYLSIEKIAEVDNKATVQHNFNVMWDDMHPNDKARWENKEEYVATFTGEPLYKDITTKEIKDLDSWTHPVTGKVYTNVKEVVCDYKSSDGTDATDTSIYASLNGRWYFFSSRLSKKDTDLIKAEATDGPSYAELSKNPDKFIGVKAKYTGKVEQIQESDASKFIRLDVTDLGYGYWKDVIWVSYTQNTDVLEGDIINISGILNGSYTYTSQANYNISIPAIRAVDIEKSSPQKKSVSSQATSKSSYKINEPIKLGNYTLTVNSFDKCVPKYPDLDTDNYPLAVSITQTNNGTKPLKYNMFDFSVIDMFGDMHTPTLVMCDKNILSGGTIDPGKTITGYLGFDIPTSIIPSGITELVFEPYTIGLGKNKITVELQNN